MKQTVVEYLSTSELKTTTMGTQYKKANEVVLELESSFEKILADEQGGSDHRSIKERADEVSQRLETDLRETVEKLKKKADDAVADPDKALFGPKMVEKVLQLYESFSSLESKVAELYERQASQFSAVEDVKRKEEEEREERERQEAERLRREEEERLAQEEAARKARIEAEEKERREKEEKARRQKEIEEEAMRKQEEKYQKMIKSKGGDDGGPQFKWMTEPVNETGELTIEKALQWEEEGTKQKTSLLAAIDKIRKGYSREVFRSVLARVAWFISHILDAPSDPKYRKIRVQNPNFQSDVVQFEGGVELFTAVGFDEQLDEPEEGKVTGEEALEPYLVMNRVNTDNLRVLHRTLEESRYVFQ